MANETVISVMAEIYRKALRSPDRVNLQWLLVSCRDFLAEATGSDPRELQGKYESELTVERARAAYKFSPHRGMFACYVVRPGDTLSEIGERVGVDWSHLWKFNKHHLRGNSASEIYPGEIILIP